MSEAAVSFSATVNRLFKLQERVKEEINSKAQEYRQSAVLSLKNPIPAQLQGARMTTLREKGLAALQEYQVASSLYLAIRRAIGEAGIETTGLLAELDQMKSQESLFSGVLRAANDPATIDVAYLDDYKQDLLTKESQNTGPFGGGASTVAISLLSHEDNIDLHKKVEAIRLRSFALQEEIAEANQRKITLSLNASELSLLNKLIGRG